jgi:alginate O-acetyltransferase complex protein AlgI
MVFSSVYFLIFFLPACLGLYYLSKNLMIKNMVLIVFSLIFYAWGEPIWVTLLIFSALVDWGNGLFMQRFRHRGWAWIGLCSSLVINLGLLASFKYSGFIVANVNALTGLDFNEPNILLPIGISFYTFQTISYSVDVYRNDVPAQRSFLKFLLFVASFHQLVAGPIVRYRDIAAEIEHRVVTRAMFAEGIIRFCRGLFKKVFIANVAGAMAVRYLDADAAALTTGAAWFGLVMFSLQIYFDFSGYSDMAIGLGKMFGFHYKENFNHPYMSRSITDFWRRWHMSLGGFFRDYVYIPLGGNRTNFLRNLFIVWGLTGLWHGASWNFVIWGLYFAVILLAEKTILARLMASLPAAVLHVYALVLIVLGWAIFYFTDLGKLGAFVSVLAGQTGAGAWDIELVSTLQAHAIWLVFALVACMPVYRLARQRLLAATGEAPTMAVEALASMGFLVLSLALLVGSSYNPFIYFRF